MAHVDDLHHSPFIAPEFPERTSLELTAASGFAEASAAVVGVVLALIASSGHYTGFAMGLSCVALGAALLFEGGAISSRLSKIINATRTEEVTHDPETMKAGAGIAGEAIAGVVGIGLGMFAVLGMVPVTLSAIAVVLYGVGLLASSNAAARINSIEIPGEIDDEVQGFTREAVSISALGQVVVGLAAVVLGALSLFNVASAMTALLGLLVVGASVLLSGGSIGAKMLSILHRF